MMEYKQITIKRNVIVSDEILDNNLEELEPYLQMGFEIVNCSCTHILKPGGTYGDQEIKGTHLFQFCTYLLSKNRSSE